MINKQKRSARKGLSFGTLEHSKLSRFIAPVEIKAASENNDDSNSVTGSNSTIKVSDFSPEAESETAFDASSHEKSSSQPNNTKNDSVALKGNAKISAEVELAVRELFSENAKAHPGRPSQRTEFESYKLVWEHSRDAFSVSYVAKRDDLSGTFLIRIYDARTTNAIQIRTIQQAAKLSANLTHPNHVTVYDNGVSESGEPYIVTDYVEGESLAQLFPVVKRLNISRFMQIFNQICDVLQEAHSHQLIHANLSPSKILLSGEELDDDLVKVIDFGMPPDPVQNAFYLSPEQTLDRAKIDVRTDIYSLGCIMYEALCGSPPFVGSKVSNASLNYLHELANQYSPEAPEYNALKLLDCIIVKCLQKKPSKRFRNVRELMDALRLVNDCICGQSKKKLPPRAEKLLLFRFLDYFDRKIFVCLFAYLLLGLCSIKFISELQLQKEIDSAQLATISGDAESAIDHWNKALWQANISSKPPGLIAEMKWELANSKQRICWKWNLDPSNRNKGSQNAMAKDAIGDYKQALQYFRHGDNSRSSAVLLLNNIAGLWNFISVNDHSETPSQKRDAAKLALAKVRDLYNKKEYLACTNAVREYFLAHDLFDKIDAAPLSDQKDDARIAYFAACSYNELGRMKAPEQGIRDFEKAYLYFNAANKADRGLVNLRKCYSKLNAEMDDDFGKLYAHRAFEQGDFEAALGEMVRTSSLDPSWDSKLRQVVNDYQLAHSGVRNASPEEISPLLEVLTIEETALGTHSEKLCSTLSQLARCYQHQSDEDKAIKFYGRLFDVVPNLSTTFQPGIGVHPGESNNQFAPDLLEYVQLLVKKGEKKKALNSLEKFQIDHFWHATQRAYGAGSEASFFAMIKLYQDLHMKDEAAKLTDANIGSEPAVATSYDDEFAENDRSPKNGRQVNPIQKDEFEE